MTHAISQVIESLSKNPSREASMKRRIGVGQSLANGPHHVLPGQFVAATKRTARQEWALRPDPAFMEVFLYLLGVFAERYALALTQAVVMSTHHHIVFVDRKGQRGDFFRSFHSNLSKVTNLLRGSDRPLLGVQERTGQQVQVTSQAVAETLAYVTMNPVEAGICEHPGEWPGVVVKPEELGGVKRMVVRRPDTLRTPTGESVTFFDKKRWPEEVTLEFSLPSEVTGTLQEDWSDVVPMAQSEMTRIHREVMSRPPGGKKRRFVGVRHALAQSVWTRTKRNPDEYAAMRPRVKAGRGQHAARATAIAELKYFQKRQREALAELRLLLGRGVSPAAAAQYVVFPAGTFLWKRLLGVVCEGERDADVLAQCA